MAVLANPQGNFQIYIDGNPVPGSVFGITPGAANTPQSASTSIIATGLAPGPHTIEIRGNPQGNPTLPILFVKAASKPNQDGASLTVVELA
jgi:hypothetical protein